MPLAIFMTTAAVPDFFNLGIGIEIGIGGKAIQKTQTGNNNTSKQWQKVNKMVVKICNTLITITDRKCGAKSAACISGSQPRWKCINWVYPSIKLINSKFAWIVNNPCARSSEHEVRTVQGRTRQKSLQQGRVKVPAATLGTQKHIHSPVFR